ncbi:hypothetical protein A2713_00195 [candidate division WWE3 bacterium RIFCSPHIGHO2_01_FULL_35_17]|uniref:5'-3' exonuclease domain-containing protein n=1 Tax=candidate division WWE3 bacterium RIFCSPHIGHO2_01_FULL_35_17 TaxID=1802614 RepID=A0A1F4UR93_UNCKA|nr:MAG: hypothetical protein A2713_00195 [candidate division WWE3 bacterium RIFCSPHIGHO2_01_FULL_35_17]
MSSANKLLLLDTFYFLHRSFHAYPKDLIASNGEHTNIVFGFASSLLDSILTLNPTHIACGWESEDQPSFRKELYPLYQFSRVSLEPEDDHIFKEQLPRVINLIEAFNIPRLTENGFEGDDVLGTASTIASKDLDVVISTADQDLLQLISDKILVFRPARPPYIKSELFDFEKFKEKYGFEPKLMIDYKALRGDPSDGIPGVMGIGDVTAKKLIEQFGSLESIYEHIEDVKSESVKKKLIDDKDEAFMSKQLATIITNIPMEFNLKDCVVHEFDVNKVKKIFDELNFKSLNRKLDMLEKRVALFQGLPPMI